MDDVLCHGEVEHPNYSPAVYGWRHEKRRSYNMAGNDYTITLIGVGLDARGQRGICAISYK